MDDIEGAALIGFRFAEEVDEAVAHPVRLVHEIGIEVDRAAVVVDAVDELIGALPLAEAHEHMRLVAAPLEGRGQLGHMHRHSADGDRVKTFPGKRAILIAHPHPSGRTSRPPGRALGASCARQVNQCV